MDIVWSFLEKFKINAAVVRDSLEGANHGGYFPIDGSAAKRARLQP